MEKETESNYSTNYWIIFGNYPIFIQKGHEGCIRHFYEMFQDVKFQ